MDSNKGQRQLIAEYVNNLLINYEQAADVLPLTQENCIQALHDGVVLSYIVNKISTSGILINESTLKKTRATVFHKLDQVNRALEATKLVGLNLVNIRAQNIVQKKENIIIGLFNQIMKQKPTPKVDKKEQKKNPFYQVTEEKQVKRQQRDSYAEIQEAQKQRNIVADQTSTKQQDPVSKPVPVQNFNNKINQQKQRQQAIRNLKINQNQVIPQAALNGYNFQNVIGPELLVLSGSLRHGSTNRGMVREIEQIKTRKFFNNINFHIPDLGILPLYNHDIVSQKRIPKAVQDLRNIARKSVGILIATPQYNGTFSGIIKNAFDWLSDNFDSSPLNEKKIGILSASYLTQNQIKDTVQMGQYFKCNYYRQSFYISLRSGAFSMQTGKLTNSHEIDRLALWYQGFSHFLLDSSPNPAPLPSFIIV